MIKGLIDQDTELETWWVHVYLYVKIPSASDDKLNK